MPLLERSKRKFYVALVCLVSAGTEEKWCLSFGISAAKHCRAFLNPSSLTGCSQVQKTTMDLRQSVFPYSSATVYQMFSQVETTQHSGTRGIRVPHGLVLSRGRWNHTCNSFHYLLKRLQGHQTGFPPKRELTCRTVSRALTSLIVRSCSWNLGGHRAGTRRSLFRSLAPFSKCVRSHHERCYS